MRRLAGFGALALLLTSCQAVPLTRPYDPPLDGLQRAALWVAAGAIPALCAAIVVLRPSAPRSASWPTRAGAFVYAAAGATVLLGFAIGIGAAIRVGGLGCPEVLDTQRDRPETLLQVGCTPGYDDSGLLVAVGLGIALPLGLTLIAAALLLLRDRGVTLFAFLALTVAAVGLQVVLGGDLARGSEQVVIGVVALSGAAGGALLCAAIGVPGQTGSGSPSSPGMTRSQRSLQSPQR